MGAWGHRIEQNDTTADVIGHFEALPKSGLGLRRMRTIGSARHVVADRSP